MDSILKAVPIGLLIRSAFSGGFFVIAFYITTTGDLQFKKEDFKDLFDIVLPISLFAGMIVYGIQRSWFYPLIECFFESSVGDIARKRFPLISDRVIDVGIWRNNLNFKKPKDNKKLNDMLTKWSDLIHTQYTATLCILFGSLAGLAVDSKSKHSFSMPLFCAALLLFLSGFVHDWRHHRFIARAKERKLFVEELPDEVSVSSEKSSQE